MDQTDGLVPPSRSRLGRGTDDAEDGEGDIENSTRVPVASVSGSEPA